MSEGDFDRIPHRAGSELIDRMNESLLVREERERQAADEEKRKEFTSPVEDTDVFVHFSSNQRVHGLMVGDDDRTKGRAELNGLPLWQI